MKKLLSFFFLCLALGWGTSLFGRDHFILVDISHYKYPWWNLSRSFELEDLKENFYLENPKIVQFHDKEFQREALSKSLMKLSKRITQKDRVILYLRGQITSSLEGREKVLLFSDMEPFAFSHIKKLWQQMPAKETVLILDSLDPQAMDPKGWIFCRAGGKVFSWELRALGRIRGQIIPSTWKMVIKKASKEKKGYLSYKRFFEIWQKEVSEKDVELRGSKIASLPQRPFLFLSRDFIVFQVSLKERKVVLLGGRKKGLVEGALLESAKGGVIRVTKVRRRSSEGLWVEGTPPKTGDTLDWLAIPISKWKLKVALKVYPETEKKSLKKRLLKLKLPRLEWVQNPDDAHRIIEIVYKEKDIHLKISDPILETEFENRIIPLGPESDRILIILIKKALKQFILMKGLTLLENPRKDIKLQVVVERAVNPIEKVNSTTGDRYFEISKWEALRVQRGRNFISFKVPKGTFLRFQIRSNEDGYLYIVNIDSNGTLKLVLPNDAIPISNQIQKDTNYIFPPPSIEGALQQETSDTREYVKILFSKTPINIFAPIKASRKGLPFQKQMGCLDRVQKNARALILQKIRITTNKEGKKYFLTEKDLSNLLFLKGWKETNISYRTE